MHNWKQREQLTCYKVGGGGGGGVFPQIFKMFGIEGENKITLKNFENIALKLTSHGILHYL